MRVSRYGRVALWVFGVAVAGAMLSSGEVFADQSGFPSATSCYGLYGDAGTCIASGQCASSRIISGGVCSSGFECCSGAATTSGPIMATPEGGGCVDSHSGSAGSCRSISTCTGTAASQETCMLGYICCVGMAPSVTTSTPSTETPSAGTPLGTPLGTSTFFPSSSIGVTCQAGTVLENGICIPVGTGLSRGDTTSSTYSIGFITFSIPYICALGPVACVLVTFMNWILAILGFVAIISFVIAGLQYILALGEPRDLERAKNHFRWSIIGIVVALSGMVVIYAVDSLLNGYSNF